MSKKITDAGRAILDKSIGDFLTLPSQSTAQILTG